ncbi:phosphotransferase family protein [Paraconexibacter algicola]|uniref:phosphotransferase family protein n=1 Tax=Paraconexibacter algicola TaxID=2133960 RepID=UPI001304CAC6|nr:hypothetical protein [Paraconexibacter algicola]
MATRARAAGTVTRLAALHTVERLRAVRSDDPARVPTHVEDLTPAWLTAAICEGRPDVRVVDVEPLDGHSGTTSRRRLRLHYEGAAAGLPETVFTKSNPSLLQRITQAITGPAEARFYLDMREHLDLEAPHCYHAALDTRRMASALVLEDLVATRGATFLGPADALYRPEAESLVRTLATLHGTFAHRPISAGIKSYVDLWKDAFALANIEEAFTRCLRECGDLLPAELRADPKRTWRAVTTSIARHADRPLTALHNDVHLGNWYRASNGALGLCDWQAVVGGDGARDLAYALSTTLLPDDRRAWEHDLVALYAEELARRGGHALSTDETFKRYREQTWGALAFWAPTYSPPKRMPSDMQPREVSGEMLRRIGITVTDLDAFAAVEPCG